MPKQLLMRSILITTTISSLAAANPEYPDYIYVDLGYTVSNPNYDYLHTIQYDIAHYLDDAKDLESRLLFRLNNIHDDNDSQRVNISGWIDNGFICNDPAASAHAWTVSRQQSGICWTDESLDTNDVFSWATAISDKGHIAGMTGTTTSLDTLHKATAWEYLGFEENKWVQTTSDPHTDLLQLMSDLEFCEGVPGNFESAAFGILDIVDKGNPTGSDYVITGGCDAGCNICEQDYRLRTFRWFSDRSRSIDVIAGGSWGGDNPRVEHQYALGFLDDIDHAIGQGQVLKGFQNTDNCFPHAIAGYCNMPTALPTSFDFLGTPPFEEHLDFEEPIRNVSGQYEGYEFYKYNFGILRDAFEGDVAGSTKDNIACDDCKDGSGCELPSIPGSPCNECYYRAVHWKNMSRGGEPEMLPLLGEPSEEQQTMSYFGHGIGQFEGNLQITGTLINPIDGGGHTNSALVWQTNSTNEWLEPIDLNQHLDQGRINIDDLDCRINRDSFRLLSAHDVNDQGWIVGQALVHYNSKLECAGVDQLFRRPFLLIPMTSANETVGCKGDLNNDGQVDSADLGLLLMKWGSSDWQSDLNCDGIVNGADFGLLFVNWGPCSICP